MHEALDRPSSQEVDAPAAQVSSTRPAKREADPSLLDGTMHLVQERWDALDLVDHDPLAGRERTQLRSEPARVRKIRLVQRLIEKVDAMRCRVVDAEPGTLSCPPRPEKKEGPFRWREESVEPGKSYHVAIIRRKMATS